MYQKLTSTLAAIFLFLATTTLSAQQNNTTLTENKGYKLMKTYCYVCHNPNVVSHDQMLAPPMMMVKRHYKPNFPNREDFINAIVSWVHHPASEKVLMPGAVRKFKLMPPLAYPEEDLKAIAAYMFDHEMDKPVMMMNKMKNNKMNEGMMAEKSSLSLNDGKKWKVDAATLKTMDEVNNTLANFEGKEVADYHRLGKTIFTKTKQIILDKNNKGEAFEQLHSFFHGLENNMHQLMEVKNVEEGEKYKGLLEIHARSFSTYFED